MHLIDLPRLAQADPRAALAGILDEARELAALRLVLRPGDAGPPGLDWLSPENLAGLRIERDGDGWTCDLDLSGLSWWHPDCIGAPEPLPTMAEALSHARSLVADVVLASALRARLPKATWPIRRDPDSFDFAGLAVPLPAGTVAALRRCGAESMDDAYVARRLSETHATAFGGMPPSAAALRSLPDLTRRAMEGACAMAALKGMAGWSGLHARPEPRPEALPEMRLAG